MLGDHTNSGQAAFGHDGWDPPEGYGEFANEGGGDGGGGGGNYAPRRFRLPTSDKHPYSPNKPVVKRFVIVGAPFYMWEHDLFKVQGFPKGMFTTICLKQNKIDERGCPLCDEKIWPSWGGYFTVVDMGFVKYEAAGKVQLYPDIWTDKKGEEKEAQFRRCLMVAKKGGRETTGMLPFMEQQRARLGDLTGTVWDTTRTGKKDPSIGKNWQFVENVVQGGVATPDQINAYLEKWGAEPDRVEDGRPSRLARITLNDVSEHLLLSYEKMATYLGKPAAGSGTRAEGAGWDDEQNSKPAGERSNEW